MLLVGVLLVAFAVRGVVLQESRVISRDGCYYVTFGDYLRHERWSQFLGIQRREAGNYRERDFTQYLPLEQYEHPLYSASIALAWPLTGDGVAAGRAVSLLFGTLAIVPLYLLTRRIFGRQPALCASGLFAFHPYFAQDAVNVLSDPLFIGLFMTGAWLAYEAVARRSLLGVALAAWVSALAYLTRPEGFGLLLVLVGAILLYDLGRRPRRWLWRIVAALEGVCAFAMLAMPYIAMVRVQLGYWWITPKKPPTEFLRNLLGDATPWTFAAGPLAAITPKAIGKAFLDPLFGFEPLIFILVLTGLIFRRTVARNRDERYLWALLVLYAAALVALRVGTAYQTHRHYYTLILAGLPFAGVAVTELGAWLARRFSRPAADPVRAASGWTAGALVFFVAGLSFHAFSWGSANDVYLEAGKWIASSCKSDPGERLRLMTGCDSRVAFYAGAYDLHFPLNRVKEYSERKELTPDVVIEWAQLQRPRIRHLVVERRALEKLAPRLIDELNKDPRFRLLKEVRGTSSDTKGPVLVYEIGRTLSGR